MKGLPRSQSRGPKFQDDVVKAVLKFDKTFTVLNGTANPGIGSVSVAGLPKGMLMILGSRVRGLIFSTASANAIATWDGDWAVGSAPNADANLSTAADFDLNGVTGGQAIGAATAKVSPTQDVTSWKGAVLDNKDGSKEVNLNVMIDDASQSGDIVLNAKGILELVYVVL